MSETVSGAASAAQPAAGATTAQAAAQPTVTGGATGSTATSASTTGRTAAVQPAAPLGDELGGIYQRTAKIVTSLGTVLARYDTSLATSALPTPSGITTHTERFALISSTLSQLEKLAETFGTVL